MKRKYVFAVLLLACVTMIAGCGSKSQESVQKKIIDTLQKLDGYKVEAEMTMKTGQDERSYDVHVWYKRGEEDFYRVGLESDNEVNGQVILKNDEGVFVLTPALNKSFKFQTDWPENSSQPYLFQSLVDDVIADKDAVFTASDTHYVFETKTNYHYQTNLPVQEVYFDKKTYTPTHVRMMDEDRNVLVEVTFAEMSLNPTFGENDFDRKTILESATTDVTALESSDAFDIKYPLDTKGAELTEQEKVTLEDGERVIMTFKGERNFTLVQERETSIPTSTTDVEQLHGDLVDLGFSIGALTNDTIEWNDNGTHFYLASEDMTIDELLEVATSIYGKEVK